MQEKVISCGIIIRNEIAEVLLCHVTGQSNFDFPKGVLDRNESRIDCACRELFEETGLIIDKNKLVNLGEFDYLTTKTLHLFLIDVKKASIDMSKMNCTSFFIDNHGNEKPEVDYYEWVKCDSVRYYVNQKLQATIDNNALLKFIR